MQGKQINFNRIEKIDYFRHKFVDNCGRMTFKLRIRYVIANEVDYYIDPILELIDSFVTNHHKKMYYFE